MNGEMERPAPLSPRVAVPSEGELLHHGGWFKPGWWLPRVREPEWAAFLANLPLDPDRGPSYHRISRADLLAQAAPGDHPALGRTLVASYVWGTGRWAFLVGRRARAFRDTDPEKVLEALSGAAELLRTDPVDAYASMLPGQPNAIKHLGPSFLTKFLYAVDWGAGGSRRALILDRFVAAGMNDLEGWSLPSWSWTAAQYKRWLGYAHTLAERDHVRADAVELGVFLHGQELRRQARKPAR
jgi:hypothetical protein